jgi:hypothetical protein
MVHISCAYLTKKQILQSFWFYAVVHSAHMMNAIPGKFGSKLASPFILAHGVGHDKCTWFPIFSICYSIMKGTVIFLARTVNHTQWTV